MTREQLYQSIYTNDTIYLPPLEEDSAPLEVALGCSWKKCTFCDFAKDDFHIHSIKKIEENIKVLSLLQPDNHKLFLLGQNPFVITSKKLLEIFDLVHENMPQIRYISMYARVDDILAKSTEDLAALRAGGLCSLHIGIESGSDLILSHVNKGITSSQMISALSMLDYADINYHLTVIPGLGGRKYSELHALETANLLNKLHPLSLWCIKIKLWEGTSLYDEATSGKFDLMSDKEILSELRLMLLNLELSNCNFSDTTVLNRYTIQGKLPEQKEQLLKAIDYLLTLDK